VAEQPGAGWCSRGCAAERLQPGERLDRRPERTDWPNRTLRSPGVEKFRWTQASSSSARLVGRAGRRPSGRRQAPKSRGTDTGWQRLREFRGTCPAPLCAVVRVVQRASQREIAITITYKRIFSRGFRLSEVMILSPRAAHSEDRGSRKGRLPPKSPPKCETPALSRRRRSCGTVLRRSPARRRRARLPQAGKVVAHRVQAAASPAMSSITANRFAPPRSGP
jgi:hypothetical protein